MCAVYMPANMLGPPSQLTASGGTNWAEPVSLSSDDIPSASGGKIQQPDVPASNETLTFKDFLDIINPLQHIPVVGTIYRAITGDQMKDYTHIVGDALYSAYSGPVGFLASVGSVLYKEASGKSPEDSMLAAVGLEGGDSSDAGKPQTAVASADTGRAGTGASESANTAGNKTTGGVQANGSDSSTTNLLAAAATSGDTSSADGIKITNPGPASPLVIDIPAPAASQATSTASSAADMNTPDSANGNSATILQAFSPTAQSSKPDPATISAAMDYGLKQYEAMSRIGGSASSASATLSTAQP